MLTSTCFNCGQPKSPSEYGNAHCGECMKVKQDAEREYAEKNPHAPTSDALYAGRAAMSVRSHHANRNYIDPRTFSGMSGMIPVPPGNSKPE